MLWVTDTIILDMFPIHLDVLAKFSERRWDRQEDEMWMDPPEFELARR
jgi:hypothetical protein